MRRSHRRLGDPPGKLKDGQDRAPEAHAPDIEIEVEKSLGPELLSNVESDPMPRRIYITKALLDKHGLTEGCPGCITAIAV